MYTLLWGALSTAFVSIAIGYKKKSLGLGKISNGNFKMFDHFFGIIAAPLIIILFGFNNGLLTNYIDLFMIFIITIFKSISMLMEIDIYKKNKDITTTSLGKFR